MFTHILEFQMERRVEEGGESRKTLSNYHHHWTLTTNGESEIKWKSSVLLIIRRKKILGENLGLQRFRRDVIYDFAAASGSRNFHEIVVRKRNLFMNDFVFFLQPHTVRMAQWSVCLEAAKRFSSMVVAIGRSEPQRVPTRNPPHAIIPPSISYSPRTVSTLQWPTTTKNR